jgi:hypothetical protein
MALVALNLFFALKLLILYFAFIPPLIVFLPIEGTGPRSSDGGVWFTQIEAGEAIRLAKWEIIGGKPVSGDIAQQLCRATKESRQGLIAVGDSWQARIVSEEDSRMKGAGSARRYPTAVEIHAKSMPNQCRVQGATLES